MIKKIRATFILNKVFSNINEEIKLKLIKYNKFVQKKLDIDITNYKLYKGKYIIYETKFKGKDNDYNGKLIYEGEYLNGERSGKGEEYNEIENKIFEGEYSKGKRNGKGIEYDGYYLLHYSKLFEGEFLNGEKNGFGIEYNKEYENKKKYYSKVNI